MIELLGLLYGLAKDIKNYVKWDEESKIVDREWLEMSGFGKEMEGQGYKLCWSHAKRVETRTLEGYQVVYEIDQIKRIRRRIERGGGNDSLVLLGKKKNA